MCLVYFEILKLQIFVKLQSLEVSDAFEKSRISTIIVLKIQADQSQKYLSKSMKINEKPYFSMLFSTIPSGSIETSMRGHELFYFVRQENFWP